MKLKLQVEINPFFPKLLLVMVFITVPTSLPAPCTWVCVHTQIEVVVWDGWRGWVLVNIDQVSATGLLSTAACFSSSSPSSPSFFWSLAVSQADLKLIMHSRLASIGGSQASVPRPHSSWDLRCTTKPGLTTQPVLFFFVLLALFGIKNLLLGYLLSFNKGLAWTSKTLSIVSSYCLWGWGQEVCLVSRGPWVPSVFLAQSRLEQTDVGWRCQ